MHAAPRAELRRRALSRGAAVLLSAAPLFVSAQFSDIKTEFKNMDYDGDGFASKQEFIFRGRRIAESIGITNEEEIAHRVQALADMFDEVDLNEDRSLDLLETEYMAFLVQHNAWGRSDGKNNGKDAEVRRIVDRLDADKDGKVCEAELLWLVKEGEFDADTLSKTFARSDLDGNKSLDHHEVYYASWRLRRLAKNGASVLHSLVHTLQDLWDDDNDGYITQHELAKAAEVLASGNSESPWPFIPAALEKARQHFAQYDTNGDGRWEQEEALGFASYVIDDIEPSLNDAH